MKKRGKLLEGVGLSENESVVYLALAEGGPMSISKLSRATGITRSLIYKIIPKLTEKKLVEVTPKGKSKIYMATSPEILEELFEERSSKFKTMVTQLKYSHGLQGDRPIVTYMEGKEGIRRFGADILRSLKKGGNYYRYSATIFPGGTVKLGYFPKSFREDRDYKDIQRKIITNEHTRDRKKKDPNREIRVIPKDFDEFDHGVSFNIYANKIGIIDYNTETAISIENEAIACFQKKIFKLLFKKLPNPDRKRDDLL